MKKKNIKSSLNYWWNYRFIPTITLKKLRCYLNNVDHRPKGHGKIKWAIDRDGDIHLIECPQCHNQSIGYIKHSGFFECWKCEIVFSVYVEDGIRKVIDHRKDNVELPVVAMIDPYSHEYRIGIHDVAPWWWEKRTIYRDLKPNGKDAHGHAKYEIKERIIRNEMANSQEENVT